MPSNNNKKKSTTATKLNLTEFNGEKKASNDFEWAEDNEWEQGVAAYKKNNNINGSEKLLGFYDRKAGAVGNFRDAQVQPDNHVPIDMQPPFLAHISNLPNAMAADEFSAAFEDQPAFDVISCKLVKRLGQNTFGYVEVASREELQFVLNQAGRFVGKRKIRVDVASEQQQNRYTSGSNKFGANNTKHHHDASSDDLATFRTAEPLAQPEAMPFTAEASAGATTTGVWRRGAATATTSANSATSQSSGSEWTTQRPDLGHWRDEPSVAQPSQHQQPQHPRFAAANDETASNCSGATSTSSSSVKKIPCRLFALKGSCPRGSECHFQHIAGSEWPACRSLAQHGTCDRGDRCSFNHDLKVIAAKGAEYQQNAANVAKYHHGSGSRFNNNSSSSTSAGWRHSSAAQVPNPVAAKWRDQPPAPAIPTDASERGVERSTTTSPAPSSMKKEEKQHPLIFANKKATSHSVQKQSTTRTSAAPVVAASNPFSALRKK